MKQILLILTLVSTISVYSQNNSKKDIINAELFTNVSYPDLYFYHHINIAYKFSEFFDIGINIGTRFIQEGSDFQSGINLRTYLLPLLSKKDIKTNIYLKANWQYEWVNVLQKFPEQKKYKDQRNFLGIYLGFRHYTHKRVGFMIESGYNNYFKYNTSLGLCFILKK